jgi:xylan 1,4-beta-xylosidase
MAKHRATADPVIVNYKNDYYLFSTIQWGYWWSSDILKWNFISKKFLRPRNEGNDELCAQIAAKEGSADGIN